MITAYAARNLVRKLVKPAALWLNSRQLARAQGRADRYMQLRVKTVPSELRERTRCTRLSLRRKQIQGW
jgi:hypothetical protein